jgi:hypothetical protein
MKRHHKLSLWQPELTLSARAGFSKVVVRTTFDVSENMVDENKITDPRIFNMDETSHKDMQRPEKIIAQKANVRLEPLRPAKVDRM